MMSFNTTYKRAGSTGNSGAISRFESGTSSNGSAGSSGNSGGGGGGSSAKPPPGKISSSISEKLKKFSSSSNDVTSPPLNLKSSTPSNGTKVNTAPRRSLGSNTTSNGSATFTNASSTSSTSSTTPATTTNKFLQKDKEISKEKEKEKVIPTTAVAKVEVDLPSGVHTEETVTITLKAKPVNTEDESKVIATFPSSTISTQKTTTITPTAKISNNDDDYDDDYKYNDDSSININNNNDSFKDINCETTSNYDMDEKNSVDTLSDETKNETHAIASATNSSEVSSKEESPEAPTPIINISTLTFTSTTNVLNGDTSDDINAYRRKLAEAQYLNKQLKIENETLHEELQDIRHEMEELQDQFRLDDADEFRQLQAELEIAAKNCRILQFKLRKLEKKNESLETEKMMLQDKLDDFSREAGKILDLEEELLIAKEVSIRLHGELEQAQEWRMTTEKLNKELKKQLDDLKDYLDNEIKNRNACQDYSELVLVNKLYESMFREYFLQEQLYSMSNSSQSQNVTKQLREVTDLLNSYQQKIAIFNEEIDILKQQLVNKDKELDQLKLQLKNLKRSKSSESAYERNRRQLTFNNSVLNGRSGSNSSINTSSSSQANSALPSSSSSSTNSGNTVTGSNSIPEVPETGETTAQASLTETKPNSDESIMDRKQRSMSVDTSETLSRQIEIANDEIRLLRNKLARVEDDLLVVTQERDNLSSQLDKIEDKAMKSFTTILEAENETELDLDSVVIKQMNELKKKIDQLNVEAKQNEESKNQLSSEIKQLRQQLDDNLQNSKKLNEEKEEKCSENESEKSKEKEDDLKRDDSETDTIKNLTDADKLLRDECKLLKLDLDGKNEAINKLQAELQQNFSFIDEMKKLITVKEEALNESQKNEKLLAEKIEEVSAKVACLTKQVEEYEINYKQLRSELESKSKLENELNADINRINSKLADLSQQLQEKISEIEFLNRENNALQERTNSDDTKIKSLESESKRLKFKIDDLVFDLETKSRELARVENLIKSKEFEIGDVNNKLQSKEVDIKDKLEECERNKIELISLQAKYSELSSTVDDKVNILNKEIERLNSDKEKLQQELDELKNQQNQNTLNKQEASKSQLIENEIDHEKAVLEKLENQAQNAKYETKIQYLEVEIDTLRSKIRKLLREKEAQDQLLKENQLLVKEIALKYSTDSDSWNRQKQKLLEKEKLYEESVDMRKELKKAADKLRQKLQSLEEQIIDKQNKHTIEKNNWETQRVQYVGANNKLEEQLSKLSTLKRSKKEIEFAWDKERRELNAHIVNLENFIKDLQSQLTQRNTSLSQIGDQYGQNERIQSLFGENEFLKNRIKELEIMLDEMEQVKRFLFDVKEAYEADRHEWMMCKEEFKNQLEVKENLWLDCSMRLNELISVIRALQLNEPIPMNLLFNSRNEFDSLRESSLNDEGSMISSNKNESLNNLVGGTSNLLELKFASSPHPQQKLLSSATSPSMSLHAHSHLSSNSPLKSPTLAHQHLSPSKLNLSHLKTICEQSSTTNAVNDNEDIVLIDTTKDRKELDYEFEQAFKKMNRVKDNYSTHKKFMDIVKSKSMKALNRKSSVTSLPVNEAYQGGNMTPEPGRGSVPPDHKMNVNNSYNLSQTNAPRAKSVSKEPMSRDSSQKSNGSNSSTSVFAPSRFFSLSRRFAKIRFSSSSQPPPPIKSSLTANSSLNESDQDHKITHDKKTKQMAQSQMIVPQITVKSDDQDSKKNMRERALSPSRLLRSLRPRSPFSKSRSSKSNANTGATTLISGTTGAITGKNKSFTVGSNDTQNNFLDPQSPVNRNQLLMSASYHSSSITSEQSPSICSNISNNSIANRFIRATTAGPSDRSGLQVLTPDKLRSLSCEFIDNSSISSMANNQTSNNKLRQLNETLDEYDEQNADNNSNITASSFSNYNGKRANKKINIAGLTTSPALNSMSKVEILRKNFSENANNSSQNSEIVKTVKFKEPPEKVSPDQTDSETNSFEKSNLSINDQESKETKLMQALDEAIQLTEANESGKSEDEKLGNIGGKKSNVKFGANEEGGSKIGFLSQQRLKTSQSTTNVDKPPKGPSGQLNAQTGSPASTASGNSSFGFRNKFTGTKSKTIDFPDLLQTAIEFNTANGTSKGPTLSNGKPIQSILRRSETPPSTKHSIRQPSIESTESTRETSIEKLLKSTSSTSRPLMFNN